MVSCTAGAPAIIDADGRTWWRGEPCRTMLAAQAAATPGGSLIVPSLLFRSDLHAHPLPVHFAADLPMCAVDGDVERRCGPESGQRGQTIWMRCPMMAR